MIQNTHHQTRSFESPLVVSKWDKKIGPWRGRVAFFNYIFGSIGAYNLVANMDALHLIIESPRSLLYYSILAVSLTTSLILFHLTSQTEMKGAVKVYEDHLLLVNEITEQKVWYKDVDQIKFERHSDYHRPAGYEVPKKHGNKLFIVRNNIKKEFEFVLNSEIASQQFNDFIMNLRDKWPRKIVYTTC